MKIKPIFKTISIIAIFSSLLFGCSEDSSKGQRISIAVIAPISGKYSDFGKDITNGVQLAVDELNANGGINGKPVSLVIEDEKSGENEAISAAHLVASKDVLGVIGHGSSGATLAASPIYYKNKLALVIPAATNPNITRQGFNNLFRVPITDNLQGPAILDFTTDRLGFKKIAIIHNKGAYGEGIALEFKKALNSKRIQELIYSGINPEDKDFRSVITSLKPLNPEAIFYGGEHPDAALFIKQARELGLESQFIMGDGCFSPELIKLAGNAVEGAIVSNIAPLNSSNEETAYFYESFVERYQKIVAFAPLAYESANILLDAISKAENLSKASVLAVLQNPNYSYTGILGTTSFSKNGDSNGKRLFFYRVEGGQFRVY